MGRSRLETEFEELEVLGSGGFGDVIKVGVASAKSTGTVGPVSWAF